MNELLNNLKKELSEFSESASNQLVLLNSTISTVIEQMVAQEGDIRNKKAIIDELTITLTGMEESVTIKQTELDTLIVSGNETLRKQQEEFSYTVKREDDRLTAENKILEDKKVSVQALIDAQTTERLKLDELSQALTTKEIQLDKRLEILEGIDAKIEENNQLLAGLDNSRKIIEDKITANTSLLDAIIQEKADLAAIYESIAQQKKDLDAKEQQYNQMLSRNNMGQIKSDLDRLKSDLDSRELVISELEADIKIRKKNVDDKEINLNDRQKKLEAIEAQFNAK